MGLEAYATVINVSPDDVARANERLQEHPAGSDLDPFTRWQDPANAQVTTAWVAFHEPLFWQGHRSGDWPQILKQLEAVQAAWPGKDVWYHSEQDTAGVEAPLSESVISEVWHWWWDSAGFADEFEEPGMPCDHAGVRLEVERTELEQAWGFGSESLRMEISCDCYLSIVAHFRTPAEVDTVRAALRHDEGVRRTFLALAFDGNRGLVECADVAVAAAI